MMRAATHYELFAYGTRNFFASGRDVCEDSTLTDALPVTIVRTYRGERISEVVSTVGALRDERAKTGRYPRRRLPETPERPIQP